MAYFKFTMTPSGSFLFVTVIKPSRLVCTMFKLALNGVLVSGGFVLI